jgi:hypothetical protein
MPVLGDRVTGDIGDDGLRGDGTGDVRHGGAEGGIVGGLSLTLHEHHLGGLLGEARVIDDLHLGAARVGPWRRLEEVDEFADGVVSVLWVAERELAVDFVVVAASDARLAQVAGFFEVADDLPDGAFGDVDGGGDVSQACAGVGGDAGEYVRVGGDEPPVVVVVRCS